MVDKEDLQDSVQEIVDNDDVEQVKKQLESAAKEVETFTESLLQKEKEKANYAEQVENIQEIRKLQVAGYRKIEPTYEFEKDDKYWELALNELKYQHRQQEQTEKGTLNRFDAEIEMLNDRIEANTEKVAKLTAILDEE